jgi:FAD/FMN-containing dehydrogenase/Fe-S oxidoreductase
MIPILGEKTTLNKTTIQYLEALKNHSKFTGVIRQDFGYRLVTSTDNSIYQVMPQTILQPRTSDDIIEALKLTATEPFKEIKITARGGGTGTNGQSLNDGIIIDVSKFMCKILDLNLSAGYVDVEPGVVLDELNKFLKPHGVFFAPEISPSNRATLGGMCNTDACGMGSRVYGKTSNHILSLDLVLSDGTKWSSFPLTQEEVQRCKDKPGIIGDIHRTVDEVVTTKKEAIDAKFPKLTRFLTGYNLKMAYDENGRFNLNYIIAGSEGTLAIVSKLRLKLTPLPKVKQLILAKYHSFQNGLKSAEFLVEFNPVAIETVDGKIMKLARTDAVWSKVSRYFSEPDDQFVECVNLIEFCGNTLEEVSSQVDRLSKALAERIGKPGEATSFVVATNLEDMGNLWGLRKKGVGLLGNVKGSRRPIGFIEDAVVAPKDLASYIGELTAILDSYGLEYGMFGHVDAGCMHVRPALDMKNENDEKLIREISTKVKNLVLKYNGIIWGEHGKGFRSEFMPEFFGNELYDELCKIKGAFDPLNKLNPGKLCVPYGSNYTITKIDSPTKRGHLDRQIPEHIRKEFEFAITCNGNGLCFNFDPDDVMCPSFRYSKDRIHSPKGRAGMMREWLRQLSVANYDPTKPDQTSSLSSRNDEYDFSHEVYDAMSGCLSCKACTSQCPIKVDIPDLKSRFLEKYHTRYRRPTSDKLIANAEFLHHRLSKVPWLYNFGLNLPFAKTALTKLTGMIDPPLLSDPPTTLRIKSKFPEMLTFEHMAKLTMDQKKRAVILIQDPMTSLYEAEVVLAFAEFCKKLDLKLFIAPFNENGKGKHVKGFLTSFRKVAAIQNAELSKWHQTGIPMVCLEPAIALTYREEYVQYLGSEHGGYKVLMIQEWLSQVVKEINFSKIHVDPMIKEKSVFSLFGHCGEKTASPNYGKEWSAIFEKFGLKIGVENVGCCGMAGAFGHEEKHFSESKGIYKLHWKNKIDQAKQNKRVIIISGASCRSQLHRLEAFNPQHPIVALNESVQVS